MLVHDAQPQSQSMQGGVITSLVYVTDTPAFHLKSVLCYSFHKFLSNLSQYEILNNLVLNE